LANRNDTRRKNVSAIPEQNPVPGPTQGPGQSSLLNFSMPTEIVDLPSKGMFYPKNSTLSGRESIEIKFMTAKDEDILTSPSLLKKGVAIDRMLENIILDKTINPTDLLIGDRNALLVAARVTGYGRAYEVNVTCPSCGETHDNEFDLGDYEQYYKNETEEGSFNITENGSLQIELPKTGFMVEFRPLNGRDENQMAKARLMKVKNNLPSSQLTDMFKRMIVSINGVDDRSQISEFVDNMPALDSRFLRLAYQDAVPNLELSQAVECPHCGYTTEMEVPITGEFFWPG